MNRFSHSRPDRHSALHLRWIGAFLFASACGSGCSANSTTSSGGLNLPEVTPIVGDSKPEVLASDSSDGGARTSMRMDRSPLSTGSCTYGSTAVLLACLTNEILAYPVPTDGTVGQQVFHWLESFDSAMAEVNALNPDTLPHCASSDPVSYELAFPGGISATVELQCRLASSDFVRAFGIDADGNTTMVQFTNPDSTSGSDIVTIARVNAAEDHVDAWILGNGANAADGYPPTIQRISATQGESMALESRMGPYGAIFAELLVVGTTDSLHVEGTDQGASAFTSFCVDPATGEDLADGDCDDAVFPTTDLTGSGSAIDIDFSNDDSKAAATAAISAIAEMRVVEVPLVE